MLADASGVYTSIGLGDRPAGDQRESPRQYADDFRRAPVQLHAPAGDVDSAAEAGLPETIVDEDRCRVSCFRVRVGERTADAGDMPSIGSSPGVTPTADTGRIDSPDPSDSSKRRASASTASNTVFVRRRSRTSDNASPG